jgi:PCFT/HCP family folate transporter-like MFS transporter 1/3
MGGDSFFLRLWKSISIEPVLFVNVFGISIVMGAQISTNLLIWKICHLELNYPEEICGNLTDDAYKDVEEIVQADVNNFQMKSQWISSVPIIFFSIIAGALSDEFGRKPLLIFPIFGNLVSKIAGLLNYAFIRDLPLEFFYVENIGAFFGGYAVYYLGVYSFVTNITKPKDRAHRLARLDGMEILGSVAGTLLSPLILEKLGYYGNYGISSIMIGISLVYLVLFVKEPIKRKLANGEKNNPAKSLLYNAIVTPLQGMKLLITKKRKNLLKVLILLQFICFFIYWLIIEINILKYLYMLLVFEGFDEKGYAYYSVFHDVCCAFYLMMFMPFLNAKLRIHDALMLAFIIFSEVVCYAVSPFATELWQFYIATGVGSIGYCKYAVVRSLLSKCVSMHEIGKVFSILAVIAALAPVAGNPIFRQLYNATIDTFPGAIFTLGSSLLLLATFINVFIYTQRDKLVDEEDKEKEEIKTVNGAMEVTTF